MGMSVDEAGQDGRSAQIDDLASCGDLDRFG